MLNEQKLSQYVDQLFLYTTEKTNVKPSCHAKADIGSLIEDDKKSIYPGAPPYALTTHAILPR